jgi:hypothetical protein
MRLFIFLARLFDLRLIFTLGTTEAAPENHFHLIKISINCLKQILFDIIILFLLEISKYDIPGIRWFHNLQIMLLVNLI